MFQPNDKVICIDAIPSWQGANDWTLTENGIYTIDHSGPSFCFLKEAPDYGWRVDRFELVEKVEDGYEKQFNIERDLPETKSQSLWDEIKAWWKS